MGRSLISITALLATALALQPAAAQTVQTGPGKGDAASPASGDAAAITGFTLAPGTALVPTAFSEVGYDTNPSQTFAGQKGSGFVRSGGGFDLTTVTKSTVTTIDAGGSALDYFSNPLIGDPVRYAGSPGPTSPI